MDQALLFEPGVKFSYSNLEYDLLGAILERIEKKPYYLILQELFQELGMNSSFLPDTETTLNSLKKTHPDLASGYIETEEGEIVYDTSVIDPVHGPSGGLISTVEDLLKWT